MRAGYAYLAIPAALFLVGWLRWWWAVPALAALAVGFWRMWVQAPKVWVPAWSRRTVAVAAMVCVVLGVGVVFSGIGGISHQHWDHGWRNAIFEMLVAERWPVVLDSPLGGVPLTYYLGFWLPAALVGKAAGLVAGWAALLAWAGAGLAILAVLVSGLLRRFAVWPVLVFAVFGGMDLVEKAVWGTADVFKSVGSVEFIDSARLYGFTSFGDQWTTVFNQALPAWILTVLVLSQRDNRSVVAVCALGAIECPLPEVGLAVIVAVLMFWCTGGVVSAGQPAETTGRSTGGRLSRAWARARAAAGGAATSQNALVGAVGAVVFGSYFAATLNQTALAVQLPQTPTDVARLAVFWVFEFGIMFALIARPWRGSPLWWAALGTMLVLPLLRVGAFNELNMRAVIPAQVVLYMMVCWTLAQAKPPWRSLRAVALAVILALGSGSTLHTAVFHGRSSLRAIESVVQGTNWRVARQTLLARLVPSWRDDPTAVEPYWR
ncbi:MAG: hypothetical protein LBC97_16490, partial [Bifidobacteriaceae bacterium]|nr:hypothetical protein [Bifidobacteriaceae bacterium]